MLLVLYWENDTYVINWRKVKKTTVSI